MKYMMKYDEGLKGRDGRSAEEAGRATVRQIEPASSAPCGYIPGLRIDMMRSKYVFALVPVV